MHSLKFFIAPVVALALWLFLAAGTLASFGRLSATNEAQQHGAPTARSLSGKTVTAQR
jgi:hypothetical protein